MQDIKAADWSDYVAPFWPAVIKSALSWKGITSLLKSGNSAFSILLISSSPFLHCAYYRIYNYGLQN